ncbi:MAG TPA: alpha/beta hydrolase, partial [Blastocatellia bacterium]|nr:alpha/beta hydrolase [Blastocatellia bacterium]
DPIYLIGHSLGGAVVMVYSGVFPDRVKKAISIEGLGPPPTHRISDPLSKRLHRWIQDIRSLEKREPRSYPNLEAAVNRMKEANPHLKDDVARHLTLHGTNWNSDGSLIWKFDNFVRPFSPHAFNRAEMLEVFGQIACPVLIFWGLESFMGDPEQDDRTSTLKNYRLIRVPKAGHWVHHDQLKLFLDETQKFLSEP